MVATLKSGGTESINGVLPLDGLCDPLGGLREGLPASMPDTRYPMARTADGQILCDQLEDSGICRAKAAMCTPPSGVPVRRWTAL